jgi:hypothetical protein
VDTSASEQPNTNALPIAAQLLLAPLARAALALRRAVAVRRAVLVRMHHHP